MIACCTFSCNKADNLTESTAVNNADTNYDADTESTTEESTTESSESVNKDYVIEKDGFSLVCKDGESYILLHKDYGSIDYNNSDFGMEEEPHLHFDDCRTFADTIRNADFSEEQLKIISQFRKSEDGKIIIPDVNNIYYPVVNGNMVEDVYITWYGYYYLYDYEYDGAFISARVMSQEEYDYYMNLTYEYLLSDTVSEDGKRVVYYDTGLGDQRRDVFYSFENEGHAINIRKQYYLTSNYPIIATSDSIPMFVTLYYRQDDVYYQVAICYENFILGGEIEAEWSDEKLLSFAMEKYVPPETDPQPKNITQ